MILRAIVVIGVFGGMFQNCAANYGFTGGNQKTSSVEAAGIETPPTPKPPSTITHETCTSDGTQILYAGQHYNVGMVAVSIVNGSLNVVITLKPGIVMNEVHINIGSSVASTAGAPGQFALVRQDLGWVSTYIATLPLTSFELNNIAPIYVAVHAIVAPTAGSEGQIISGRETAWADGERAGVGWETVFRFAPEGCTDPVAASE